MTPLKELSTACAKQGVHFGVYYSQLDWHHPAQENDPDREGRLAYRFNRIRPGMKERYVADMKAQLKELILDYHVEILFFDGEWVPWWTQEDGQDLMRYVRGLNPALIVNNRIGKRKREDGDYGTPEQTIPAEGLDYDWETCMTLNGTWGYKSYDHNWKSTKDLVHKLVDIASKGGNFLLNVGPDATGVIPEPSAQRLREIGQWLAVNGDAVYATRLWNAKATDAVRYTLNDDALYATFFDWPDDGRMVLAALTPNALTQPVSNVELLGSSDRMTWSLDDSGLHVQLPDDRPCPHAWSLKISTGVPTNEESR